MKATERVNLASGLASVLRSDFPNDNGLDVFAATKAMAMPPMRSDPAIVIRRVDRKEFGRLNQREVFIDSGIKKRTEV